MNIYFPSGETLADRIGESKFNEILLNSIDKSCYKQAYFHGFGFYCKYILFKKDVNMFESMEIPESIYKGVVSPSYKNPTQTDANFAGRNKKNIL